MMIETYEKQKEKFRYAIHRLARSTDNLHVLVALASKIPAENDVIVSKLLDNVLVAQQLTAEHV